MDVTSLTSLINALRAETQEESISPESLGALLQKIVDQLAKAALDSSLQNIINWKSIVERTLVVLTALKQSETDRNNINMIATLSNLSTGIQAEQAVVIKQATTERAGAMRAQQVTDLNWCRNRTQEILATLSDAATTLSNLQTAVSTANNAASRAESTALEGWNRMLGLQYDLNTLSGQVGKLEKAVASLPTSSVTTQMYHIECQTSAQVLYVRGAISNIQADGLVPYIFRYSLKQHRLRKNKSSKRVKGPKHRGWHVFYGKGKADYYPDGLIKIRNDHKGATGEYYTSPEYLFAEATYHYDEEDQTILKAVRVPYGKKNYDVLGRAKRFRFGIAFGTPTTGKNEFLFSQLRTNIAEIRVYVRFDSNTHTPEFYWSR